VILVFWIGVFPNPFLTPMHTSVAHLFEQMNRPVTVGIPSMTGTARIVP